MTKPQNNVWEVGFWSTDDEEDNDSDVEEVQTEEEEEEYYDEEDDEQNLTDPTEKIQQERYESTLSPEERKYMMQVSETEKKIL